MGDRGNLSDFRLVAEHSPPELTFMDSALGGNTSLPVECRWGASTGDIIMSRLALLRATVLAVGSFRSSSGDKGGESSPDPVATATSCASIADGRRLARSVAGLAGAFDATSLLTLSLPTGLPRRFDSRLFLLGGEAGARMRLVSPFPLVALDHSSTCSLVALRVTSPLFPLVVFAHASTCSLVALWPVSP